MNNTDNNAQVYTDEALAYRGIQRKHDSVKHSVAKYVKGQAHTNGIESFRAVLKRAHMGTFHRLSPKHLQRYVNEFSGRHDIRRLDTKDQISFISFGMQGKRLRYTDLILDIG